MQCAEALEAGQCQVLQAMLPGKRHALFIVSFLATSVNKRWQGRQKDGIETHKKIMVYPEFDGNEEEMPWILATQSQRPRHFSNNASNYKHIDNMDYSMPYIDIFIFAFSCLISPILKHFFGIEIPNESRIKARSGSSISQKR